MIARRRSHAGIGFQSPIRSDRLPEEGRLGRKRGRRLCSAVDHPRLRPATPAGAEGKSRGSRPVEETWLVGKRWELEEENMRVLNQLLTLAMVGVCLGAGQERPLERREDERVYQGWILVERIIQLTDERPRTRIDAANALGRMGPEAKPAIPALTELLRDKDPNVRIAAVSALGRIASAAVPALTELRKNVGPSAGGAPGMDLNPSGLRVVGPLIRIRPAAARALGQIGPAAIPALTELLRDKDWEVRCFAAEALGKIGSEAKMAIPALTALLKDKNPNVRVAAAEALGGIGPEAKTAIPALIRLLKETDDPFAPQEPASAPGEIAPETVPGLTHLLKDEDISTRCSAISALGRIGPEAKTAIPVLTGLLKDKDWDVRCFAAEALGKIGSEAKMAIPALTALLKDKNWEVRCFAAEALGRIGSEARTAIATLTELLKDEHDLVRVSAAEALGKMGPEARTAIPALTESLKDEGNRVRTVAAAALQKIKKEKQ
ncbi:MAG: HEAT repeat domain-containing protein [Pirellulales bacterium]